MQSTTQLPLFEPARKPIEIGEPQRCFSAEAVAVAFFPRLSAGIMVNRKNLKLVRNNIENKYEIDWAIVDDNDDRIGVIDTEYKPNWWKDKYPCFSVARYTLGWNNGSKSIQNEAGKIRSYRAYPDISFWMAIRADLKYAGITTGRVVIESHQTERPRPKDMVRNVEIFEFPNSAMKFSDAFDTGIEEYILEKLNEAGQL